MRHPNVVSIIGCNLGAPVLFLVLELMLCSLQDVLFNKMFNKMSLAQVGGRQGGGLLWP